MDTKRIWEHIRCTSVGLYRMGRDAVSGFFARAYTAGGGVDTRSASSDASACDRHTDGEASD